MSSINKILNFGAGPGKIPDEVLKEAQKEFLSYKNIGFSVTELSHRSNEYAKINQEAQNDLKELLYIPDNYKILFLHGGGQGLFSAVPMNLINKNRSAVYAVGGIWSHIASNEARKYGQIKMAFPKPDSLGNIPDESTWFLDSNASYYYYCDNETIEGIEFPRVPDIQGLPLVADMSSNLLTRKIDVSKFGAIIAAVQKNLGTAGLGIIIIREDLLGNPIDMCPSILNFKLISDHNSILNTPPIFSVYLFGKVLKWIKRHGGVEAMQELSRKKSKLLYETIDNSNNFYQNNIPATYRSRINIPFRIKMNLQLEEKFLKGAEERNMFQLKGHKLVGGIRVSLYNGTSYDDVVLLTNFMKNFQEHNS